MDTDSHRSVYGELNLDIKQPEAGCLETRFYRSRCLQPTSYRPSAWLWIRSGFTKVKSELVRTVLHKVGLGFHLLRNLLKMFIFYLRVRCIASIR